MQLLHLSLPPVYLPKFNTIKSVSLSSKVPAPMNPRFICNPSSNFLLFLPPYICSPIPFLLTRFTIVLFRPGYFTTLLIWFSSSLIPSLIRYVYYDLFSVSLLALFFSFPFIVISSIIWFGLVYCILFLNFLEILVIFRAHLFCFLYFCGFHFLKL